ncbi:MAG: hypothetical protein HYV03_07260 [Deltaproteobacteria bacterium]|nr:hypothetical protein [Deltaproteobacteria bacterium]
MEWRNKVVSKVAAYGIAAFCVGYFASYVPYSMLTKMLTSGILPGMDGKGYSGFVIQPLVVTASTFAFYLFLTAAGWWRYATRWNCFGWSLPRPRWFTFLAGICTSGIIITTTLAYSFEGISIVFAMLLMRGGVLALAPIVDLIAVKRKRKIYWPSWVAATLSFGALFVSISSRTSLAMTVVATVDIVLYLACYFLRLYFMSSWAKSRDLDEMKRFFTEDQMTANAVVWVGVMATALFGATASPQSIPGELWRGLVEFPFLGHNLAAIGIGIGSCGAGIFGSLIFLDRRENTFTVPANRVSSVIAGVIATYCLAFFFGSKYPGANELIGVALIVLAIIFLAYRTLVEKRIVKVVQTDPATGVDAAGEAAGTT